MRRTADFLKRTDPVPRLFKPAFLSILSPGARLEHSSCMRGERRLRPCCDMQRQFCGSPAGFRARRRGYAGAIRQLPGPFTNRSRASTASSVTFLAAPMSICASPRMPAGDRLLTGGSVCRALQAGLRQTGIAGMTQVKGSHRLRDGALHTLCLRIKPSVRLARSVPDARHRG